MCFCCNCCNNKFICLFISLIIYLPYSFALYYFGAVSKFDEFKAIDQCYKSIKDDIDIYNFYKERGYSSTFEMLYELYPSIEPIYNLSKNIILIYTFLITFIFLIRSCMKMPKENEPTFKCYKGLILSIYILSFFLFFGNVFYTVFLYLVNLQLTSIISDLNCSLSGDLDLLKNPESMLFLSFIANCPLNIFFCLNVIYISSIYKSLKNGNLPCQNFIDEYITIDNEEFFSDKYDYLEDYNFGIIKKVRII